MKKEKKIKRRQCSIKLINAPSEILIANSLIRKFKVKNDIGFRLSICIDHLIDDYGIYKPDIPHSIFVNPDLAININDIERKEMKCYHGYVNDYSLLANTLHEFAHFLCHLIYKTILSDYEKTFPRNRLYLCEYSNENIDEEFAEIIRLYILNPYLLKMIDNSVYNFIKKYFKSPSPVTNRHSMKIVDDFPIDIKNELKEKWKIVHDYGVNKLIKIKEDEL